MHDNHLHLCQRTITSFLIAAKFAQNILPIFDSTEGRANLIRLKSSIKPSSKLKKEWI